MFLPFAFCASNDKDMIHSYKLGCFNIIGGHTFCGRHISHNYHGTIEGAVVNKYKSLYLPSDLILLYMKYHPKICSIDFTGV